MASTVDYKAGEINGDILHMNDAHYRAVMLRQACYNYTDEFDYTHGYGSIAVVAIHHIAAGGYHSSTIFMTSAENDLPDNIDKYYTAYGGKVKYATIGAGPVGGKLTSGVNREKDIILETKRDSIRFDVTYDIAKNLFRMEKYYRDNYDNIEYTTIPSLGTGYNCNSFTKGLLDAAGISLARKPNAFVPGWEKPVPSYMFGE